MLGLQRAEKAHPARLHRLLTATSTRAQVHNDLLTGLVCSERMAWALVSLDEGRNHFLPSDTQAVLYGGLYARAAGTSCRHRMHHACVHWARSNRPLILVTSQVEHILECH